MIYIESFLSAEQNMRFDDDLLRNCVINSQAGFLRVYRWQMPGLTQANKRQVPDDLMELDYAFRSSGGGLVFHSPGDIVFSLGLPLQQLDRAKTIKHVLMELSETVLKALLDSGVSARLAGSSDVKSSLRDSRFCASYFSPYEVYVAESKVLGIAAKRNKQFLFFQGVLHIQPSVDYFEIFQEGYSRFFSEGCTVNEAQIQQIYDRVLHLFRVYLDQYFCKNPKI
jgi:lipoate-protein ligase A